MKKLQLLLTALLSIVSAVAMADEVTVSNIEADAGGNAEIVVNLSTAATNITGYQMSLYLPEGVTLQTDADDDYVYTLSGRHHSSHSLSINNQADGGLMLICYSMNKKSIASGDGELLRLPVNIAPAAAGTALEGELRSVKLSDTSSNVTTLQNVSFSITGQYALEAYCVLDDGTLTFYYDDSKNSRTGTKYTIASEYNVYSTPAWNINTSITKVIFNTSFASYYPTSTAYWFNRLTDLETITGISNLKTSSVTSMRAMFSYCYSLTSLNLSNFNTSNVIDMGYMFEDCIRLTSLDLSAFKTDNVTNMSGMFSDCSRLTSLNLSSFNTSNVIEMGFMFENCTSLTSLDVSNFNTANVTDMDYMFENCNCLKTIYANSDWKSSTSIKSSSMFSACTSLVGGKGTKYDGYHVNIYYAHPDGGTSNPGYFTYKEIEEDVPEEIEEPIPSDGGNGQASGAYTVLQNGTLTFYYDNDRSSKTGTVYDIYTSYTGFPDWAKDSLGITKAVFDVSFANFKPTCTAYWFSCCPKMTEIEGLGRLDTRNVTDMRYMFHNCRSLIKLDTGDFLTSQVTDMSNMFSGCHELSNVDVTCFNTANVTTMEAMFMDCRSLTEIDVTGFETKNVSTMANMFRGCSSLSEINLKNISIASLTNTYAMFYGSKALTTIYSNTDWSTGSITSSDFMFGQCIELKGGNGTAFNANNTDKSYALPDGSNSRPGYFTMRNSGGAPGGNVGTNGAPVYAVLNNGTLTFYCDNLWNSRSGTRYDIDDLKYSYSDQLRSYRTMPEWIEDRNLITRAVFDPSFANYKPKSTVCWFYSCQSLTAIEGMEYLNTSEVTNMSAMFRFCYSLTDVDVSHMDTHNVTDMSFVFCYCESLSHIDVSKFNTEKVTNMEHMFHTCPVETLDLRSFETSKVTDMNTMFDGCGSLKTIYAKKDKWNTDNVSFSSWMFVGCNSLVGGQGTKYDSNHTDKEYAVIDGGLCAPGYLTGEADNLPREAYAVYKDSVLTFYYDENINCREGEIYTTEKFQGYNDQVGWHGVKKSIKTVEFDRSFKDYDQLTTTRSWFYRCHSLEHFIGIDNLVTTNVTDMRNMFHGCSILTSLDVSGFKTDNVTNMMCMFGACSKLTGLDVSGFKTDNVTNMRCMFYNCTHLTSLDVSGFKTDNVTDMSEMFRECRSLTNLNVSGFKNNNVTNMDMMFYGCSGLASLDVSGFKTGKVTDMGAMFCGCSKLQILDVSGFQTDNVTDMDMMFYGCSGLASLDVSGFKTDNVTDMGSMFSGCSNLTSIDVSGFQTDNVTNMSYMFYGYSGLTNLDVSGFKTVNVTDMGSMFSGCSGMTSLDVSNFDTSNVTDMSNMFYDCSGLTTIYCGNDWNTDKVTSSSDMFYNCTNLVGGAGTVYSSSHTDKAYAHVDGGLENPGYLTLKSNSQGGGESSIIEVTDISQIDNVIYVDAMEEICGTQTTISLKMKNTVPIRGFQFDLYLPEGATVVKSAKGKIQGALSADRLPEEDEHNLTFSEQQDGAIRFLCSSQYDETFTGTEGEIATLQIRLADDMADGDYAVVLKNVKLTETDINKFYETEKVVSKLTIISYISGDISGDGKVDVSDYTGVANYIHNNPPAGFNAKAADVDENGKIDVSDYTGIANIIHTGSVYGYSNTNNVPRRSGEENLPDTDVSTIDNVIYVSPFTVTAGTQTTLSFKMKNTAAIRGFQFDLYLPEGMTVVKSDKGRIQGALSAWRLPDEDEHDLTFSEQDDGAIRFLCSSQYDETFTGTDGEIATLQVNVADGMADGDYALLLREVKLTETDISKFYLTELVKTTVTVGSSAGVDVVLDETNTVVPEATAGDVTILVKRTIKANEWSTICLPFDMTEAQTKEAFGNGVQLKEFTDYEVEYDTDDNVVGITVNFDDTDLSEGFYGNYPYLIKVENDIDEFTVTSTIDPVESDCYIEYDNGRTGKNRKVYGTFKGFYHAQTTVPNKCLFLSGNKFWYSTGQTKMKAFRAYFNFVDVLTEAENASARISMSFDDETTRIVNVNVNDDENYYDLLGRRVAHPQKGLYIKNNKKVVVK